MSTPVESPICPDSWNPMNWGSSVCDLLKNLLLTNDKLSKFFSWLFTTDGSCKISADFGAQLVQMMTPIGSTFWSPVEMDSKVIPLGWLPCDGRNTYSKDEYPKLFEVIGRDFVLETD